MLTVSATTKLLDELASQDIIELERKKVTLKDYQRLSIRAKLE